MEKGFKDIPVRFFMWDDEAGNGEGDFAECGEMAFIKAEGSVEYQRHTVFLNGVSQICLTKNPLKG